LYERLFVESVLLVEVSLVFVVIFEYFIDVEILIVFEVEDSIGIVAVVVNQVIVFSFRFFFVSGEEFGF
jgi:hypothetical protein